MRSFKYFFSSISVMARVEIYHGTRDSLETFDFWVDDVKIVTAYYREKWWVQILTNQATPWYIQCNPKNATEVIMMMNQLLPFFLQQIKNPYFDLTNIRNYLQILEQYR